MGIDIGGTGLKVGVVDFSHAPRILASQVLREHAREDPNVALDRLAGAAIALLESKGVQLAAVERVGVGCAGLVDQAQGRLETSPNLPAWHGVPIQRELERRLSKPVKLVNDAEAFMALEWQCGAAKGARDALFVTVGTGVGGGMVLGGKPYRGASGLGGEFGHMTVDLGGPLCPCGNRGCLELYVGKAPMRVKALQEGLAEEVARSPSRLAARAGEGDDRAIRVYEDAGRHLGAALAGLVNLLEPEVVVVGGGVGAAGELLLGPAREEVSARSMVARQKPVRLVPAQYGAQAGMMGAALLAVTADVLI